MNRPNSMITILNSISIRKIKAIISHSTPPPKLDTHNKMSNSPKKPTSSPQDIEFNSAMPAPKEYLPSMSMNPFLGKKLMQLHLPNRTNPASEMSSPYSISMEMNNPSSLEIKSDSQACLATKKYLFHDSALPSKFTRKSHEKFKVQQTSGSLSHSHSEFQLYLGLLENLSPSTFRFSWNINIRRRTSSFETPFIRSMVGK